MHNQNVNSIGSLNRESTECFNVNSAGQSPVICIGVFYPTTAWLNVHFQKRRANSTALQLETSSHANTGLRPALFILNCSAVQARYCNRKYTPFDLCTANIIVC